jgi:putative ABC transport system permease protein
MTAEAGRGLRSQWVTSLLVGALAAIVSLLAAATAGQSDASRRAVLDTVDELGSALLVVSDLGSELLLDAQFVRGVQGIDGVAWAFGLGPVRDVTNGDLQLGGAGVPMRSIVGIPPTEIMVRSGRVPTPGEVWLGEGAQAQLRLAETSGVVAVDDQRWPVVGGFAVDGPLDRLADLALHVPDTNMADTRLLHVYVRADGPASVAAVADGVRGMLPTEGATEQALELETPAGVVALREAMAERLDRDAVVMLGTVLSAGAAVAFAVTWMSTLARRTDLGRRRALGSTRTVAVVMVLLQTGAAALLGAGAGVLAGTAFAAHAAGRAPGMGVVVALVVLTVISVLAGCLVPAVVAARADPVRVLRVP